MLGMEITIKNCNSIDEANISLEPSRLNIKYGPNGTGKSTIAKAIELSTNANQDLSSLTPFKHRGGDLASSPKPSVHGVDNFKSIAVFNEEYVNRFVFSQDEVVKIALRFLLKMRITTPKWRK